MKNKNTKQQQIHQDTRGSTWCPACDLYKQKIHLCRGINSWINIDMNTNIVIMGDSSGDVKCTDENDKTGENHVKYYKNRHELYEGIKIMASEHRQEKERERERVRVLEGYFQRPLDQVDPKL